MTLAYRDSSFDRPSAGQARAAYAVGVRAWGGYLAAMVPPGPRSGGGSNLATSWTQADFEGLLAAGIAPIAFASGWDDAATCGALARAWGVRLMLDCEDAIRGDGPWVDGWLAASGAGLYGLCEVHYHQAPAHIVARYPDLTVAASSWDPLCARPPGLLGWQAQGTHVDPATGLKVDAGWLDDGYLEGTSMTQEEHDALMATLAWAQGAYWLARTGYDGDPAGTPAPAHYGIFKDVPATLAAVQASIAGLTPAAVDVNALAAALAGHPLTATLTDVERDAIATHVLQRLAKDAAAG